MSQVTSYNDYSHYRELHAEKLINEYSYLIGESYYPYGNGFKKGKEFNIKSLEIREDIFDYEIQLMKRKEPENFKENDAWVIVVELANADETLYEDLKIVLKNLKELNR